MRYDLLLLAQPGLGGDLKQLLGWNCSSAEGVAHVGKLAANAVVVTYPTSDHWLYIEHWQKFADQVCDFAANGRLSRNFLGGMQQAVTVVRD